MGRKIVLTGTTLTDPTAPKLASVDPIESDGSLLLFEPAHPASTLGAGVPTSEDVIPNLLADKASAVYGSGDATTTGMRFQYANMSGSKGKIERTGKGGIHGIFTQADSIIADAAAPYVTLRLPDLWREWQYLHPTNDLYVSVWGRITRAFRTGTVGGTYTGGATALYAVQTGSGNRRMINGRANAAPQHSLGQRVVDELTAGAAFANDASGAWATAPTSATQAYGTFLTIGGGGEINSFVGGTISAKARWPSWVIYRVYLEDLTVSGRTYAEVDAIDYALYTKEVVNPGGRYYGDTYTDPATIP